MSGVLDRRIWELEQKDKLLGRQKDMLKAKEAMTKGVVGSGQVSQKAFDAARAGKGLTMGKLAAAGQIASAAMGEGGPTSALGGAASMASAGMAFGPAGAAVGGIAGAVMGAASAREARKAHNAKIEMQKHQALAKIEEEKGRQMSQAIGQMGMRMGMSLR